MAHVYIAYAKEDAAAAARVGDLITSYGARIWRDDQRFAAGGGLTNDVRAALSRAVCVALIYSERCADSAVVRHELDFALEHGVPVVPIRLDASAYEDWWSRRIGEIGDIDATRPDFDAHLRAAIERFTADGCPVVALMNLKGGVGKTTISSHVFSALQHFKKNRVLLVDLDPQYNLSQIFFQRTTVDTLALMDASVISLFEPSQLQGFETPGKTWDTVETADAPLPEPDQIARRLIPDARDRGRLDIIVGQFEIAKYAFVEDPVHLARARVRFKRSIDLLRRHYDLIVLDTNPSASFLTRCGIDAASLVIAPVRPDRLSIRGVRLLKKLFARLLDEPAWPPVHLLVNGVERGAMSEFEAELRAGEYDNELKFKASAYTLKNRLYDSQFLAVRPEGDAAEPLKHLAINRAQGLWGGEMKRTLEGLAGEIWALVEARDHRLER